jgi:hypothetical protein
VKHYLFILLFFVSILLLLRPVTLWSEELDIVNHPVNEYGLTGLLMTTSPYTLTPGTIEIGASIQSENSIRPDYTITEFPITVSVGITNTSEVAVRSSYISIAEGPTGSTIMTRKTGDLEVSYKWTFIPQPEASYRPAVALIASGILPTQTNSDQKSNSVSHWGARMGISVGTEISWKDHVLGIYADGQIAGQDLSDRLLEDTYGIVNAGLVFPISKYQNLQMYFEYSLITGRDVKSLTGGDYTVLTYGLRLVTEKLNLTIGAQSLHKQIEGYDDSGRVIGLISMKF